MQPVPNEGLEEARRSLDGEDWIEILSPWSHHQRDQFVMQIEVHIDESSEWVPSRTRWYVLTTSAYPEGRLDLLPSKSHGLQRTLQHQRLNISDDSALPWLDGDPCLTDWARKSQRGGWSNEVGSLRLAMLCILLRDWLTRAALNTLTVEGDPYELPQFTTKVSPVFAYNEDQSSMGFWNNSTQRLGFAQIAFVTGKLRVVSVFADTRQKPIRHPLLPHKDLGKAWSPSISEAFHRGLAVWCLLDAVPMLPPWHPITTWGELRTALGENWESFHKLLRADQRPTLALLGMPLPEVVGGELMQIHWQALEVPVLTSARNLRGFRPTAKNLTKADLRDPIATDTPLTWLSSENWSRTQFSRRFAGDSETAFKNVLIVGCGAIGSIVADLVVRGGARRIWLCDADIVKGGNLVRGTFALEEVGEKKVDALAKRLASVSPHVQAIPIPVTLVQAKHRVPLGSVDWLIECTGDDATLRQLEGVTLRDDAKIASLSVSWEATKLLLLASSAANFQVAEAVAMLSRAQAPIPQGLIISEGIGCYHPAFPADPHRIALHAATALEKLIAMVEGGDDLQGESYDLDTFTWSKLEI